MNSNIITVSKEEMDLLLLKSKQNDHPYYYKFAYIPKTGQFTALRARKGYTSPSARRSFHSTILCESKSLINSLKRIEQIKNGIMGLSLNAKRK